MANIMDLFSQPIPVNTMSDELARQIQSLRQYQMQQQAQIQPFQQILMKAKMEQMMPKQLSPLEELIQRGKAYEAATAMHHDALARDIASMGQPTQMGTPNIQPQGMQMQAPGTQLSPQPDIQSPTLTTGGIKRPEKFVTEKATTEMTPFGQRIKGTTLMNPKAKKIDSQRAVSEALGKKISEEQYLANKGVFAMYGQLKSLMSYKAAQFEEAGGDSREKLIWSWLMSKIKQPGYGRTGAFAGSLAQTSLRSAPLITGSVRIVRDITMMLRDAFPNLFDPGEYTANKAVQSLDDFFRYAKGIEQAGKKYGWEQNANGEYVIPDDMSDEEATKIAADTSAMIAEYNLSEEDEELKSLLIEDLLSVQPSQSYQMEYRGQPSSFGKPQQTQPKDEYERYLQAIGAK